MTTGNNDSPWDPNNQQPNNQQGADYQQGAGYQQGQNPSYPPQGGPGYGQQPPAGYQQSPYGQPQSSNKTPIIIAIVVVALIAIGALVFFLLRNGDDNGADGREDATTSETTDVETDDPDVADPQTEDPQTEDPFGGTESDDSETDDPFGGTQTQDPNQQYGDPNADPAKFRSGMEEILADTGLTQEAAEEQGITADQWDMYLDCVTDESLQRLTPEVIETISSGQDVYDSYSVNELADIATQCGTEAGTL